MNGLFAQGKHVFLHTVREFFRTTDILVRRNQLVDGQGCPSYFDCGLRPHQYLVQSYRWAGRHAIALGSTVGGIVDPLGTIKFGSSSLSDLRRRSVAVCAMGRRKQTTSLQSWEDAR